MELANDLRKIAKTVEDAGLVGAVTLVSAAFEIERLYGIMADWNTGDMPKDGTPIAMQVESIFRFQPYKPNSLEAKRGVKGRWQEMNEYGGWENCSHPLGNKWKLAGNPVQS